GEVGVPGLGEPAGEPPRELCGKIGVRRAIRVIALLPFRLAARATLARAAPLLQRLVRDMERLEARPAEPLLRELHLLGAERRPVGLRPVLSVRAAVSD